VTAPTTPNAELAWRVLDHIDAHPEQWNQGQWIGEAECGTVGCFAGWAVMLSGGRRDPDSGLVVGLADLDGFDVWEAADALLGIGPDYLNDRGLPDPYDGLRSRESLGEAVAEIFGPRPAPVERPWYADNPQCRARDEDDQDCILPSGHDDVEDHANQYRTWPGTCGVCGSDDRTVKLFDACPENWHAGVVPQNAGSAS